MLVFVAKLWKGRHTIFLDITGQTFTERKSAPETSQNYILRNSQTCTPPFLYTYFQKNINFKNILFQILGWIRWRTWCLFTQRSTSRNSTRALTRGTLLTIATSGSTLTVICFEKQVASALALQGVTSHNNFKEKYFYYFAIPVLFCSQKASRSTCHEWWRHGCRQPSSRIWLEERWWTELCFSNPKPRFDLDLSSHTNTAQ